MQTESSSPSAARSTDTPADAAYRVQRTPHHLHLQLRGLRQHALQWGDLGSVSAARPLLVMVHGWMDVAASFQFLVDALHDREGDARCVVALDWRGFGLSEAPGADSYWFPDYLGDLDAWLAALRERGAGERVDLLGHSMGANAVMMYAGVRPERIRRLANLEGFGLPRTQPDEAPERYASWLDSLTQAQPLRPYASLDAVAERLRKTNPLLPPERARWLAAHWARERSDGQWELLADAAHRRPNAVLYQADEALACWDRITAPVLWVEGDQTDPSRWWGTRYPRAEFEGRLARVRQLERHVVGPAGHMLHHDQPEALAALLHTFLER